MSDVVDFLHAFRYESLLKSDTKIFCWVWSSIPKVSKIASLQCLYNISKKKFIMKFIKIKTSTSWIINFRWKPSMSKAPEKRILLSFCNVLRKSIATVFVFFCEAKTCRCFTGFLSCLLLLVFANIPTVPIFPRRTDFGFWHAVLLSRIESVCPGFYISYQKYFHIYIIFHQQCKTIHL